MEGAFRRANRVRPHWCIKCFCECKVVVERVNPGERDQYTAEVSDCCYDDVTTDNPNIDFEGMEQNES